MPRWPWEAGSVARLWARLLCAIPPSPAWVVRPTRAGSCSLSRLPAPRSITIYKMGKGIFFTFIFSFSHVLANMQVETAGYERTLHLMQRQVLGIV